MCHRCGPLLAPPDETRFPDQRRDLVVSGSAFVGLASIGLVDQLGLPGLDPVFLVGSLGASAVLLFAAPESPMSRWRNVIGGHFLSALIGVTCFRLLGEVPWLSGAVAVALSIFVMRRTRTLHAPGGATALIANIGTERVKSLGFEFAFAPVLVGALMLVAIAFVIQHGARLLARAKSTSLAAPDDDASELASSAMDIAG